MSVHIRESTTLAFQSGKEELPSHGKCKFSAWKVTPSFHIVVSGLSRSLLNIKNCERPYGNMNEIFANTSNDPERQPTTGSLG